MGRNPVLKAFAGNSHSIGIAGSPHRSDKQLGLADLTRGRIDDVDRVTRKIDKYLFTADMRLPHARSDAPFPRLKMGAKPGVTKPVGVLRTIFLPQQHAGHVATAQLFIDLRPIRNRAVRVRYIRCVWKQQQLEAVVIQTVRQRPRQASVARAAQVGPNTSFPKPQRRRDRTFAQPLGKSQSQYVPNAAHGQTSCRHSNPPVLQEAE